MLEREQRLDLLEEFIKNYCVSKENKMSLKELLKCNTVLYFDIELVSTDEIDKRIESKDFNNLFQRRVLTADLKALKQRFLLVTNPGGIFQPTEEEALHYWTRNRIKVLKMLILSNTQKKLLDLDGQVTYDFDEEELEIVKTSGDLSLMMLLPDEELVEEQSYYEQLKEKRCRINYDYNVGFYIINKDNCAVFFSNMFAGAFENESEAYEEVSKMYLTKEKEVA